MAEERLNNASPPDQNYCQDVSKVIKKETQNVYSSFVSKFNILGFIVYTRYHLTLLKSIKL